MPRKIAQRASIKSVRLKLRIMPSSVGGPPGVVNLLARHHDAPAARNSIRLAGPRPIPGTLTRLVSIDSLRRVPSGPVTGYEPGGGRATGIGKVITPS